MKILLPVDGSKHALAAVRYALRLRQEGLGTLRSVLLGSVSQGVLQASRLPVTVVKQDEG